MSYTKQAARGRVTRHRQHGKRIHVLGQPNCFWWRGFERLSKRHGATIALKPSRALYRYLSATSASQPPQTALARPYPLLRMHRLCNIDILILNATVHLLTASQAASRPASRQAPFLTQGVAWFCSNEDISIMRGERSTAMQGKVKSGEKVSAQLSGTSRLRLSVPILMF